MLGDKKNLLWSKSKGDIGQGLTAIELTASHTGSAV